MVVFLSFFQCFAIFLVNFWLVYVIQVDIVATLYLGILGKSMQISLEI
jgi:hypothetical protein